MKQLGNLAVVCAKHPEARMQIYEGIVTLHVGKEPQRVQISMNWDDDNTICDVIHELNFGKYAGKETIHR